MRLARREPWPHNAHVGAREERLAGNEALFREVNERVSEVATHYIDNKPIVGLIHLRVRAGGVLGDDDDDRHRIRGDSRSLDSLWRRPAARAAGDESVIERHPSYFVVEKREQDAQEVARETDPRT
jgi:hypothetical protein